MRSWIVLPAACLLAAACACGGPPDPRTRILADALASDGAWRKLEHLSDRIGQRLSGSPGLEAAVAWTAEEMRRDRLDQVWTEPVMVPHWERGAEWGRVTAPVAQPLVLTALGGSEPTPGEGIEAEVVEVGSLEELRAAGEKIRGRIVLYNQPMARNGTGARGYGFGAGMRVNGASEAAKLGAVGTLLRSLGTADYRLPHTGMMRYAEGVPRIPSAAVSAEDADLIHRLLASGGPVRVRFGLGCRNLPDAPSANVIADLRGRELPSEIVLIGAHLDSWDLGTGAIDDGAGVAVVMETMRILREQPERPRRTVRAVLFTNEENGLRGGRTYAEVHRAEIAQHLAAIESDSGGGRPLGFGVTAGPGGVALVGRLARPLGGIGAAQVVAGGGGADISPLQDLGVPGLGLRQVTTYYFDYHHTAADTLDKIDPSDLRKNVAALAVMTRALADLESPLPRPAPKAAEKAPAGGPAGAAAHGAAAAPR